MFSVLGNIQYGYLLINLIISLSYYFECLIRYYSLTDMQKVYFILYVYNFAVFVVRWDLKAKVVWKIFLIINKMNIIKQVKYKALLFYSYHKLYKAIRIVVKYFKI